MLINFKNWLLGVVLDGIYFIRSIYSLFTRIPARYNITFACKYRISIRGIVALQHDLLLRLQIDRGRAGQSRRVLNRMQMILTVKTKIKLTKLFIYKWTTHTHTNLSDWTRRIISLSLDLLLSFLLI